MQMLLITFGVMLLVVTAMAVGVLLGRKPIKGTCGGMSALGLDTDCDICGGDQTICDDENQVTAEVSDSDLGYKVRGSK